MVPAATSNTAAVNQTRSGLLIGPTLSTLMPNGREDWGTVVTLTGYGPSKTPLTIPEINNRLRRTFEVRHQYYSTIAKILGHPQGPVDPARGPHLSDRVPVHAPFAIRGTAAQPDGLRRTAQASFEPQWGMTESAEHPDSMLDEWPPQGMTSWYSVVEKIDGQPERTYNLTIPSTFSEADLSTVRIGRHGGPNDGDREFRCDLYERVGAVVVASGHVETAMKRLVLLLEEAPEAQFSLVDKNWTDLHRRLRGLADSTTVRRAELGNVLDWGEAREVKRRRDNVVHAYWWNYAGLGARRSRFYRRTGNDDQRNARRSHSGCRSAVRVRREVGRLTRLGLDDRASPTGCRLSHGLGVSRLRSPCRRSVNYGQQPAVR
jgi:hypothetical protein